MAHYGANWPGKENTYAITDSPLIASEAPSLPVPSLEEDCWAECTAMNRQIWTCQQARCMQLPFMYFPKSKIAVFSSEKGTRRIESLASLTAPTLTSWISKL